MQEPSARRIGHHGARSQGRPTFDLRASTRGLAQLSLSQQSYLVRQRPFSLQVWLLQPILVLRHQMEARAETSSRRTRHHTGRRIRPRGKCECKAQNRQHTFPPFSGVSNPCFWANVVGSSTVIGGAVSNFSTPAMSSSPSDEGSQKM